MANLKSDLTVPERVPLVVLFAETRGFTRMSEMLDAQTVVACDSEFFAMVTDVVERHHGSVVNMFNDTLAAIFVGEQNAVNAVCATQDIQRDFGLLSETWELDHKIRAVVSMGLHGGNAVIGPGDSTDRAQVLLIGDSVSIAERLLHRARAGEFVLSQPVMDGFVSAGLELDAEELPPLRLPHRESIRIYGVVIDESRLDFT